ncbi:MAG: extracellular solute-binding protein [Candidatus Lokiarchaeota archaeon]|nr:extracellular solute-binding protein [Candidatus Lokiarchaeota archaeon]
MASEFESGRDMTKIFAAVAVIAVIGIAGIAIVMFSTPNQVDYSTLTILTRHDTAIHQAYETAFLASEQAQEAGIEDIVWKTQQAQFWDTVIDAGGIDVLWGGGPTIFDQQVRNDNLEPLTSENVSTIVERIPDEIAGASMKRTNDNGDVVWVAAAISSFGFTVNHNFLDTYGLPTPNNWTHLAQPIWGSILPTATIAMGNAPKTTSNTRIYEIITQGMGWDAGWQTMARMVGSSNLYQGSVETQAAAESGEVGVSMSIDFYGYSTQKQNPYCEYILPENETIVNGDPIAIVKDTPKMAQAEAFLDYVLSPEGQAIWFSEGINRMPVLEEAFLTETGQENTDLYSLFNQTLENQGIDFNDSLSLEINSAFTAYFEAVFNDPHDDLVDVWQAIVEAYDNSQLNESMFEYFSNKIGDPVTIEYEGENRKVTIEFCKEINDDMASSPSFYSSMQNLWTNAAVSQYDAILTELNNFLTS